MIVKLVQNIEEIIAGKLADDEVEYFENYKKIKGAAEEEIQAFEKEFDISLPEEFKELYKYKNGTAYPFSLLQTTYNDGVEASLFLLSFDEIRHEKGHFFNKNKPMTNNEFFDSEDIYKLDKRIKPFISNEKWIPFAQMPNYDIYLLLDFDPTEKGKQGQIIIYAHDPDFVYWVCDSVQELLQNTISNLKSDVFLPFFA